MRLAIPFCYGVLGLVFFILIPCVAQYSLNSFFFISNNFIDIEKGSTLVHRECTRGQTIKKKNYKNLGNQEKMKMIGFAMQPTNPLKF